MIEAYLQQLTDALDFDPVLSARLLPEIRTHLEEALAAEHGDDRQEAERRVVARFGNPRSLAAQFASISLAQHTRRASLAILVAAVVLMASMKARVAWHAFIQTTLTAPPPPIAHIVIVVDRYAFWLAAATGVAALLYIARHPTPVHAHGRYRKHLRRAASLFVCATALLGVSVGSDLILAALQFRSDVGAVVLIASMAVEIGCVAVLAVMVASAARRVTRADISLLR
jgi:hypothetical protein